VLFVGNSLIYRAVGSARAPDVLSDLPGAVEALWRLRGGGPRLLVGRRTEDAATLTEHADDRVLLRLLSSGTWDDVVLQEQSGAVFSSSPDSARAARALADAARAGGAAPFLLSTWTADRRADVVSAYEGLSRACGVALIPSARVWSRVERDRPGLALRAEDGLHASRLGTYLLACVVCESLRGPAASASAREDDWAGRESSAGPEELAYLRAAATSA